MIDSTWYYLQYKTDIPKFWHSKFDTPFFSVWMKTTLTERSCREWFQKFKNGEFDIEDKERSGRPKVHEDAELEALLDQDSCQTQQEQYDRQYFE